MRERTNVLQGGGRAVPDDVVRGYVEYFKDFMVGGKPEKKASIPATLREIEWDCWDKTVPSRRIRGRDGNVMEDNYDHRMPIYLTCERATTGVTLPCVDIVVMLHSKQGYDANF